MIDFLSSQVVVVMLTFGFYILGSYLYKITKFPLFNPLLVAASLLMVYLVVLKIDVQSYLTNVNGIHLFLGPMIVALALPIYHKRALIKKHLLPITVGVIVGSFISIGVVLLMGKIMGVDLDLILSVVPKSSTAAIAMEISDQIGGLPTITIAVTSITAVIGAVIMPSLLKLLRIKDPLIIGLSLGTTSHALGTAKALEMSEEAGAISGIALVFAGIVTVLITLFF
jgi:predicted murein hydrolase (TIGR00659 family)